MLPCLDRVLTLHIYRTPPPLSMARAVFLTISTQATA